jgi:hypothetical protein
MTTWKLSPQYKKSAVEKMFFYKDGKVITIEQGFRWATFSVESDERPLTDYELKNEDGYELGCIDNDESWEMWDMVDGCWMDIEAGNDKTTSTDVEEFEAAWEEDSYEAVEALGWSNSDTEYYYYGPLALTNEDTGEEFLGEPENPMQSVDPDASITHAEIEELQEEEHSYTEWFPSSINPVHVGTYQVIDTEVPAAWPFPVNIQTGAWDGEKWDVVTNVIKWRGLTKETK